MSAYDPKRTLTGPDAKPTHRPNPSVNPVRITSVYHAYINEDPGGLCMCVVKRHAAPPMHS